MTKKSPVVAVAKKERSREGNVKILPSGIRVRLLSVPSSIITEAMAEVEDPIVPKWFNPDKQREEENPNDPEYLKKIGKASKEKLKANIDASIMFGIDLVDELPEDVVPQLEKRMRLLKKRFKMDFSAYDLTDVDDVEFLYKKLFVATSGVLVEIAELSGVKVEEVEAALESFPG